MISRIIPPVLLLFFSSTTSFSQGICQYNIMMSLIEQQAAYGSQLLSTPDNFEKCQIAQEITRLSQQHLAYTNQCGDPTAIIKSRAIVQSNFRSASFYCGQ